MTKSKTVNKVVAVLEKLAVKLDSKKHINLTMFLKNNKIPNEYGRFLCEEKAIIKLSFGKRGPSEYVWNKNIKPDKDLATSIINSYNKIRNDAKEKRRLAINTGITTF